MVSIIHDALVIDLFIQLQIDADRDNSKAVDSFIEHFSINFLDD
jgi:hypothetical protein